RPAAIWKNSPGSTDDPARNRHNNLFSVARLLCRRGGSRQRAKPRVGTRAYSQPDARLRSVRQVR
ncbi:MAG: hypothetical protein FJ143_02730, partial [Deltaproteobacteria bacterium]|nr:hypothetical protein [Deltaproteobacteria bacterium]